VNDEDISRLVVLSASEVSPYLKSNRVDCVNVVREAYLTHDEKRSNNPHSVFLRFPGNSANRIIGLPANIDDDVPVAGVKWISSFPGNVDRGIARASAVILLNDPVTGRVHVCMEASSISSARTAASAGIAAEALVGERRAQRIGVIGAGLIAGEVCATLRDVGWQVGGYRIHDTRPAAAEEFAAALVESGASDVVVVPKPAGAIEGCDLVVFATVAGEPHVSDPGLFAHHPTVLHLSLRDLAPDVVIGAQNFTDDVDHALRERTALQLAAERIGHHEFVAGTLADLLRERVHRDPGRTAIFSPFGLGVLDLAVARWAHQGLRHSPARVVVSGFHPR